MEKCIFCDAYITSQNGCWREGDLETNTIRHICRTFHVDAQFDILRRMNDIERIRSFNLILENSLKNKGNKTTRRYYFDEYESDDICREDSINLYKILRFYPTSVVEKIGRSLLNLSYAYPKTGSRIHINPTNNRLLFCENDLGVDSANTAEQETICRYLSEMNYIEYTDDHHYHITLQGWEKIEQLKEQQIIITQGFIAISYDKSVCYIKDAFIRGIHRSGYEYRIMSEKEHNNQAMPEMYYEIKRSRFIVADISRPNLGAYYEIGYAHALGKEVIICCERQKWIDYEKLKVDLRNPEKIACLSDMEGKIPHFDIAQRQMILWDTTEELIERIERRIRATIGAGPLRFSE